MLKTAKNFLLAVVCFCLAFGLVPGYTVSADTKPYFKTFGADVFTGGWFNAGAECNITSANITNPTPPPAELPPNYQDPEYSTASVPANDYTGGILAYAKSTGSNPGGGSSSQFAAFATGLIEGNSAAASRFGFYSNGARANTPTVNSRTFANTTAWGGAFQDSLTSPSPLRQSHCIADYYKLKMPNPAPGPITTAGGRLTSGTGAGIYMMSAAPGSYYHLNNAPVNIPAAKSVTIFINGNVFIERNITYGLNTVDDVPKFALVAKGSIYIGPGVTQLDGLYIAQPDQANANAVTADTGVIWTCHAPSTARPLYTYFTDNCDSKLTVNGALIAKQVLLTRVNGDVNAAAANTAEDALATALGSTNIAELINYHPAMALGGPFFGPLPEEALINKIDSVVSLPPIF